MSQDERRPFRERERTQPGGYAAPAVRRALPAPAPQAPRRELLVLKRPELPEAPELPRPRLFNPNSLDRHSDWSGSSTPALTVDMPPPRSRQPAAHSDAGPATPPPWLRGLQLAAAGAGAVVLLIVGVTWSLGEDDRQRTELASAASEPATPLLSRPNPPASEPSPAAEPTLAAPNAAATSVEPTPSGAETPRAAETIPSASAAAVAAPAAQKPLEASAAASPPKPKNTPKDDAASPFGKWMVPPRD